MVRGSILRISMLVVLALAVTSCVKRQTVRLSSAGGTCEGACSHYMSCKNADDPTLYRSCVLECRDIYATDGVEDAGTLGELERLDCEATLGFVEGDGGSPPGTTSLPTQPAAASSKR